MLNLRRCRVVLMAAGMLLSLGSEVRGEVAPVLEQDAHVRVFVTQEGPDVTPVKRLTGTLLGLSDSVLTLAGRAGRSPILVPRQDIVGLDVRVREGQRGKGALIGLGVGIGFGVALGLASGGDPETNFIYFGAGIRAVIGALVFGPVGMLLGLAVAPGEQWQSIPPDRMQLSSSATRGRPSGGWR